MFRPLSRDNGSSRRWPCGVDPAERKDSLERLIDYRNTCAKLECPKKSTDNQVLMRRNKLPWMFCLSRVKLTFQLVICLSKRQQYYCKIKWGSHIQIELQGISHRQKLNALFKHALQMKTYADGLIETYAMLFICLFFAYFSYNLCIYSGMYTPSNHHFKAFPVSKINSNTSFLYQVFKENSNFIVLNMQCYLFVDFLL